jgi:hypothetical protein
LRCGERTVGRRVRLLATARYLFHNKHFKNIPFTKHRMFLHKFDIFRNKRAMTVTKVSPTVTNLPSPPMTKLVLPDLTVSSLLIRIILTRVAEPKMSLLAPTPALQSRKPKLWLRLQLRLQPRLRINFIRNLDNYPFLTCVPIPVLFYIELKPELEPHFVI